MGIFTTITDKLRGDPWPIVNVEVDMEDQLRCAHFQRLYDYYVGDEDNILRYVRKAMTPTFKPNTIAKMQLPYYLFVRRIIDRLCMVYLVPAERYIVVPHYPSAEKINVDPKFQKAHENYQELLTGSNINAQCKTWHKYAKLLDTVYVQPTWREDHIEYDIYPPHLIHVEEDPDNYLQPKTVKYTLTGGDENYHVVWSAEEHWILDKRGKPAEGKNPWNGANQYGVLPLVPLRLREVEDHWGEGDTQLVDVNEKVNILLASTYHNAIMQSHGQPFAVNMDFKEGQEMKTGPDVIIQAKNISKDMFPPDFRFVQPKPALKECLDQIDWMVKVAAMMRGLPASAVSTDAKAESGAAKAIDNWELIELRTDDIEWLRPFEKKLFEVSRVIWNYHNSEKKIDVDAVFGIDFEVPDIPTRELDELAAKQIKMSLGLYTPVEDMVDEDEGIDFETAKSMVKKNLEVVKELGLEKAPRPPADNPAGVGPEGWPPANPGGNTKRDNQVGSEGGSASPGSVV